MARSLPSGYELFIRAGRPSRMGGAAIAASPYEAVVRSATPGLSGGSCREYVGRGKTPESALEAVLGLLRCPLTQRKITGFFPFIRACATLLEIQDTPDEAYLVEDPSWYGCYDDGLTPEEAVAEFKAHNPWDESKKIAAALLGGRAT